MISFAAKSVSLNTGSRSSTRFKKLVKFEFFISLNLKIDILATLILNIIRLNAEIRFRNIIFIYNWLPFPV